MPQKLPNYGCMNNIAGVAQRATATVNVTMINDGRENMACNAQRAKAIAFFTMINDGRTNIAGLSNSNLLRPLMIAASSAPILATRPPKLSTP